MGNRTRSRAQAVIPGEPAAIYCRISHVNDDDQTGVDRQERIGREVAERLGVRVTGVYIDNNRSAWKRDRKRPGWDSLLSDMNDRQFRHVIVYHPDRLMRQPRDLEELLTVAEDKHILLHGQANRRDLSDPDDRFFLRIEVAHACRSSDDTSRRLLDAMDDKAREGKPHTGIRRYGYSDDGTEIIEEEAVIVREVFRRYLDGESPVAIAKDLHSRRITTSRGAAWAAGTVRSLLGSRHVAGIRVHRGEDAGVGTWPAIIDRGQWDEAQALRAHRAAQYSDELKRPRRYYLLRGVVTCTCGTHMSGSSGNTGQEYRCNRSGRNDDQSCKRTVAAVALEEAVEKVALEVLEKLDVSGRPPVTTTRPEVDIQADAEDAQQLADLKEMWLAKEVPTAEYRADRRTIEARMKKRQRQTVQRPIAVLEGIAGPNARANWQRIKEAKDYARMNGVYRFLFAAVIIHPSNKRGGRFNPDRVEIEPAPLWD